MTQQKLLRLQRQHQGQEPFVYANFRCDKRGLTAVGSPTAAEWARCLDHLMHGEENVHFWIGDLLLYGESQWGEMDVQQMVEASGYDYKTLGKFKWVASRIEASRRRLHLSFTHHQGVAGLPVDQQELILTRAEEESWTSKLVRHEVNRLACETERPAGPPLVSGLHYGNCLEIMAMLPDESIDLLLTHPPAHGPAAVRRFEDVLRCAIAKLKPNSHIYVFTTWETYDDLFRLIGRYLDPSNALLWVMTNGERLEVEAPTDHQILFAHKGRRHLNGRREGDVLYFEPVPGHPLDKPVPLLQYLIEKSTQPKDIVLDPFMGLGSMCLAAENAGRGYIGIEADRRRFAEAQRRLAPVARA